MNIRAGSLSVTGGATIDAFSKRTGNAGNVNINARDTVIFDGIESNGISSGVVTAVGEGAAGKGGDINITTGSLFLTNGAQLIASTLGTGDAGNVNIITGSLWLRNGASINTDTGGQGIAGSVKITATDTVSLSKSIISSVSFNLAALLALPDVPGIGNININNIGDIITGNTIDLGTFQAAASSVFNKFSGVKGGNGGDIHIQARSLFLSDKASIDTSVVAGQANAGNILVNAADSISIKSGAFISSENYSQGNGGNITLRAGEKVSLNGGNSEVTTGQYGGIFGIVSNGNSGNINVQTRSLFLSDGADLSATILGGQGSAGNILVNAADSISIKSGADIDAFNSGQGNGGNITLEAGEKVSLSGESFISTVAQGNGNSGNINVQTRSLSLTNGGFLSSTSKGSGAAGSIEVTTAKDILLDNGASIASNTSGGQGNITLRSRDLFLRHNSDITTNAKGTATGGNITITTGNLVAVPKENSDISANAEESFGGRVTVTAAGIFGTQFRPHLTPLSDITATSNLGPQFNGTVQLNILSPDPSRGLAELPQNVVDPASQIANNPCTKGKNSEFTITGRGGLPPNPNEALNSDAVGVGLVEPVAHQGGAPVPTSRTPIQNQQSTIQNPIVPAQGWVFNEKGQVVLTAYNPTVTQPQRPWRNPGACHAL